MSTLLTAGTATSGAALSADTSGSLQIQTGSTPTTAITVDSSQNVGIGTNSPQSTLHIQQGSNNYLTLQRTGVSAGSGQFGVNIEGNSQTTMSYDSSAPLVIGTATTPATASGFTERMRIDNNGRVLINNNTSDNTTQLYIESIQSAGNRSVRFQQGLASGYTGINAWSTLTGSSDTTNCQHFGGYANGGAKFAVYGNGNVQNTNNSYGALSDVKLKENIVDATPKLDDLMQVKIRNFNLIADKKKSKQIGVIAQELEQIFPALVEETPDRDEEGHVLDTTTKQVKYSVFVPMLIKAIQELNAKVDAQAATITALQAKVGA
jgi:hypothetical protein